MKKTRTKRTKKATKRTRTRSITKYQIPSAICVLEPTDGNIGRGEGEGETGRGVREKKIDIEGGDGGRRSRDEDK